MVDYEFFGRGSPARAQGIFAYLSSVGIVAVGHMDTSKNWRD
jgi:hypothetical protein